jgi:hypothetical protein
MADFELSQLSVRSAPAAATDYVPLLVTTDTTTPPAGPGGSDQRSTIANVVKAAIDGTSGDIQPSPGTQAAGTVGKPADAGHVHGQPALFAPTGLTGAVQAARFVGATTSGAPASGTFAVGDFAVDRSGTIWLCTSAGSPGTWVALVNRTAAETISGAKTFTGGIVVDVNTGNALVVSSDGTTTSAGGVFFNPSAGAAGGINLVNASDGLTYLVAGDAGGVSVGPFMGGFQGGWLFFSHGTNTGNPVGTWANSSAGGPGLGSAALTVLDTNEVVTFSNTLDDGTGNATVAGVSHLNGGTDTSGTATASTPSLVSGTAAQLSTTQDVMLYIDVTVATNLTLAIGSTSSVTTTVFSSATAAIGLITLRIPKGWFVKATSTGTFTNFTFKQVTC